MQGAISVIYSNQQIVFIRHTETFSLSRRVVTASMSFPLSSLSENRKKWIICDLAYIFLLININIWIPAFQSVRE